MKSQLTSILRELRRCLKKLKIAVFGKPKGPSSTLGMDMRQREKAIYGEYEIGQRRLYEKWVVKPTWVLETQAIPLFLGIDPEEYAHAVLDEKTEQKYRHLKHHVRHCVEQDLLRVSNMEAQVEQWEAKPIDVYKWAVNNQVDIPVQLSTLMEFVIISLGPTGSR